MPVIGWSSAAQTAQVPEKEKTAPAAKTAPPTAPAAKTAPQKTQLPMKKPRKRKKTTEELIEEGRRESEKLGIPPMGVKIVRTSVKELSESGDDVD